MHRLQEQTPKDPNVELKSDVEKDMKACLGLAIIIPHHLM